MSTIYTNISNNKRNTVFFMFLFITIFSLIVVVLTRAFLGDNPLYIFVAMGVSVVTSLVGYYNSDKIALASNGAKEVSKEEQPYLHSLVENLCIGAGLPKPRVYIIDSPSLNAFATGRDPKNSAVCFTTGIINRLEKIELEGVIAHELAHIQNFDIRLMTVVGVMAGSITIIIDWISHIAFFGGDRRNSNSIFLVIGIFAIILAPIVATVIQLAISRNREYLADASAALLTRYPKGLSDALLKISQDDIALEGANGATAHMFISNPFKSKSLMNLFSTHPPIEERVKRLNLM